MKLITALIDVAIIGHKDPDLILARLDRLGKRLAPSAVEGVGEIR